ncbi:hypothetical protein JYK00_04580 [Thermosipho ferrireducens]|uniref:Uncharacterized protein n=1 Tax=Thermosipho ferrireducens TaxID=2571116 RepID=A0ABX7S870_9BACT|nr:hypothetical protein [Thermosipho ferrireducens]QTA38788.1 hypothetical protein JYK00_04580 [Thermosipho ferrireducens]
MFGVNINIEFYFKFPFLLDSRRLQNLKFTFDKIGFEYYNFFGFFAKKKFRSENGCYILGKSFISIKTLYCEKLSSTIPRLLNYNFFGKERPQNVFVKKIEQFYEGYLISQVKQYSGNQIIMSESIRKKLIEKYRRIFNKEPDNNSFLIIFRESKKEKFKKIYLYGSSELIYLANILGLDSDSGFSGYIMGNQDFRKNNRYIMEGFF